MLHLRLVIPEVLPILQVRDLVHPKVAELVGCWLLLLDLLLLEGDRYRWLRWCATGGWTLDHPLVSVDTALRKLLSFPCSQAGRSFLLRRLCYLRTFVANLAELQLLGSLRHLRLGLIFVIRNALNKQIRCILILERQLPFLDGLIMAEVVRIASFILVWGGWGGFLTIL